MKMEKETVIKVNLSGGRKRRTLALVHPVENGLGGFLVREKWPWQI